MNRKIPWLIVAICLASLVVISGICLAAEKEPAVGHKAGNVAFSAPITPDGATYLGLAKPGPFKLKDIKADYVLVESFNTT